ncbi:protein SAR DEFICIENT 1-like [Bidens hawaiensis]|uniref:protein SAR DEFICIENT 1-like n=1 Tax=Bidens hawaiensis TaxID=980011 RepID=UPI004049DEAD
MGFPPRAAWNPVSEVKNSGERVFEHILRIQLNLITEQDKEALSLVSELKTYKLIFSTGVASPVFTGKAIRGESSGVSEPIDVILVDNETNKTVDVSKRVRVVLLPEDFGGVWTSLQFKNSIITDWRNKKNILQGNHSFNLVLGRGTVPKIWIKHDKKHLSKSKFLLGAMIDDGSYDIKEAITDPFEAIDRRNELISKNRSVTLADKVSRLRNVGRNGKLCKRLEHEKIMTVKDFLDRLSSNPVALQKIYGSTGKGWEVTVRHAKTSISDKMVLIYLTVIYVQIL